MAVICVTYDLHKPRQDWKDVDKILQSLVDNGSGGRPLQSTWFIATGLSPEHVMAKLEPATDTNDAIIVFQATRPGSWRGLHPSWSAWLQANL